MTNKAPVSTLSHVYIEAISPTLLCVKPSQSGADGLLISTKANEQAALLNSVFYTAEPESAVRIISLVEQDDDGALDEYLRSSTTAKKLFTDLSSTGFFRVHTGIQVSNGLLARLDIAPGDICHAVTATGRSWQTHFPDARGVYLSCYSDDLDAALQAWMETGKYCTSLETMVPYSLIVFSRLTNPYALDTLFRALDSQTFQLYWICDLADLQKCLAGEAYPLGEIEDAGFLPPVILDFAWELLEDDKERLAICQSIIDFHNLATSREILLMPATLPPHSTPEKWGRWRFAMDQFLLQLWNTGVDPSLVSPFTAVLTSILQGPVPRQTFEIDLTTAAIYPFGCLDPKRALRLSTNPVGALQSLNAAFQRSFVPAPCSTCAMKNICPSMATEPGTMHDHGFGLGKAREHLHAQCSLNQLMMENVLEELLGAGRQAAAVAPPLVVNITEDKQLMYTPMPGMA